MTETHRADHLLVIRLNNFQAIEIAFGEAAAIAAMEHLRRVAERHLGRIDLRRMERGEMTLRAHYPVMRCVPMGMLIDTLCAVLGAEPFRYLDHDILLSISAGHAGEAERIAGIAGRALEDNARARLAASTLSAAWIIGWSNEWAARYRKDMGLAAMLIRLRRRGATCFTWRPVSRTDEPGTILYYEAVLRRVGDRGEQMDCADGYAALERLGLAHLIDRPLLSDVLDELEADPAARLSIAISTQSLSLNLHGEDIGWSDLIARLTRDPSLARRLVIEIADNSGIACFRDARAFVRALRQLSVRISIARFGSGHASIGQLTALSPDVVKLDSAFMHSAYQCERNRMRVGHLLRLARTMSRTVIVDGIESPWHLHLAMEEGADWVAGSHLGRPSVRRGWLNADYGDSVASLTAFNSALHHAGAGGPPAFSR